ncbi:hypothetical protein XC59_02795 [Klebsiella pneumoniae]|nr:hypothetical protein [Klebsiella pneumoniae]
MPCPGNRHAQRHTDFTHPHLQLISSCLNRVMDVFRRPVANRRQLIANHFQRLTRHWTQMFFRGVGIEFSELFIEVAAALGHLFQRLATLAQQFHQLSQLRAVASVDIFLLDMPLQMRCHILRRQGIDIVMV